jgi:hypothetical protein
VAKTVVVPVPASSKYPHRYLGMGCVFVGIAFASFGGSQAAICSANPPGTCSLVFDEVIAGLGLALMVAGFVLMLYRRAGPDAIEVQLPGS